MGGKEGGTERGQMEKRARGQRQGMQRGKRSEGRMKLEKEGAGMEILGCRRWWGGMVCFRSGLYWCCLMPATNQLDVKPRFILLNGLCLSVCLFLSLSVCVSLSLCLSLCRSFCICVCLALCLYLSHSVLSLILDFSFSDPLSFLLS